MKVIFVEDGSVLVDELEEKTGLPVVVYRQGAKRPEIVDIPGSEGVDNSYEVLTEKLKNICIRNNYVNVLKVADNCLSSNGVMSPSVPANFAKCDRCPYRNEHFCKSKLIEDLTNIVKEFILELGLAHYRFSNENKGDKPKETEYTGIKIPNNESNDVEKFKSEIRDILNANKYPKIMHARSVCEACNGCRGCDYEKSDDCCEALDWDMSCLLDKIATKVDYSKPSEDNKND